VTSSPTPLVFKAATEDWEFEQVHRLNYRTFVEEIPQHPPSPDGRLVDRFHAENTYLICLRDRQLVGMLAVRGNRPFSLDQKLPDLDSHLPAGRRLCEVRLLAVEKPCRGARGRRVLRGLLALLHQHGVARGYDLAVVSGTTRQLKLYRHLGFVPFGPLVGSGEALFQPMYVTLESFEATAREFLRSAPGALSQPGAVNFLPGPVAVPREVRRAFEQEPESHRGEGFKKRFQAVRQILCSLVGARRVGLFLGSGTLANDVVAAQLALEGGRGLVLSNGEFGGRLVDHARRFQLKFAAVGFPWGAPVDLAVVRERLVAAAPAWLWCTHCETSTGLICELGALKRLCAERGVRLCVDCISSIGTMPVDLGGVHFATGSSGKGLRSYPGIALVFHNHDVPPAPGCLPRYLDLGHYARQGGAPFTFSSNLLYALHAAVQGVDWPRRFAHTAALSALLRSRLTDMGFTLLGNGAPTSPAVVTVALPADRDSATIGEAMQRAGFLLSYNSDYLLRQNWIQVCLMGECTREKVVALHDALDCFRPGCRPAAQAALP
jgi:aspartate aminotransferase-like enzyme